LLLGIPVEGNRSIDFTTAAGAAGKDSAPIFPQM